MVWQEFGNSPGALIDAAKVAREAIAERRLASLSPSRGPLPTPIAAMRVPHCDAAFVYLARLDGFETEQGEILLKVGFSGDPNRRSAELNAGFPSILPLCWLMIRKWQMQDLIQAYRCEQVILTWAARRQFSCGGEFLLLPSGELGTCQDYCQRVIERVLDEAGSHSDVGPSDVARRRRPRRRRRGGPITRAGNMRARRSRRGAEPQARQ